MGTTGSKDLGSNLTSTTTTSSGGAPTGAAGGDLGSTYPNPTVVATHLSAPLPVLQGGTGQATAIYLTGTLATMNAATGVNGQLFYNTTYNALFSWVVDRWLPHGAPDPRYGYILYDEFIGSDRIGMLDWGTGGGAPPAAGNLLNPGIYKLTQAAANGAVALNSQTNSLQFGTGDYYCETNLMIPTLSNGTDNLVVSFGWNDNGSFDIHGDCTDGAQISYDNATATASWICKTYSNTSSTSVVSSISAVAGTWTRLGILVSGGTNAKFFANGVSLATISTTLPTGAGRQTGPCFKIDKTLGAGSLNVQMDYYYSYGFFNGQRVS